jgi:RNA polymerase sigma-70 factor, ECF subfamily
VAGRWLVVDGAGVYSVRLAGSTDHDADLLEGLRRGDEDAFVRLVERYHPALVRLARLYVSSSAAEDVVQETWIGVLRGLATFESRATFKTWLFRILVNRARTRAVRDARTVPLSDLIRDEIESPEAAVEPSRFQGPDGAYPGHWASRPDQADLPEQRLLSNELDEQVRRGLAQLPPAQGEVVRLRDVLGLSSDEVCQLLNISEGNQRVLLHRGRSKLRGALESYMAVRPAPVEETR